MKKKLTFESQMKELEALVQKMDLADLPLEEAIDSYEKGIRLSQTLNQMLDEAQQKVEFLSRQGTSEG